MRRMGCGDASYAPRRAGNGRAARGIQYCPAMGISGRIRGPAPAVHAAAEEPPMKLPARLDALAGRMNRCLAIVAIALGIIDLAVLVAQRTADDGWRRPAAPAHGTAASGHHAPHRPALL